MPLVLVAVMAILYAVGVYLFFDRSLTRVLLGFLLVGNATNLLLLLTAGAFGEAPILGESLPEDMTDPLPQAFILTAIVITFGVSAFLLALIYRSWRIAQEDADSVQDDTDDLDLLIAQRLTTSEITEVDLEHTEEFHASEPDSTDAERGEQS